MVNRNIHALLSAGRVVLLQHPASGLIELAVVLGAPDCLDSMLAAADTVVGGKGGFGGKGAAKKGFSSLQTASSGSGAGSSSSSSGPDRVLWLLVLHNPGPLDPPAAESSADAVAAAAAHVGECAPGQHRALHGRYPSSSRDNASIACWFCPCIDHTVCSTLPPPPCHNKEVPPSACHLFLVLSTTFVSVHACMNCPLAHVSWPHPASYQLPHLINPPPQMYQSMPASTAPLTQAN